MKNTREQYQTIASTASPMPFTWPTATESEVITNLKETPGTYARYLSMNGKWRQALLDYLTGCKTLPLTYDPFFKRIFHPDIHPHRLSAMLSSIMGMQVKVLKVLPNEEIMIEGGAMLIMDIIVELEDHTIVNIEVQKIPYGFPAERMSCYSADLILRQYSRVKGELGKEFSYKDIKKVYTIIFFENSTNVFKDATLNGEFFHYGRTTFNTGLKLELLQEYFLIALDVFKDKSYARDINERNGWISLLAFEDAEEAERLMQVYPWLIPIYADIAAYRSNPQEVFSMYSEALRIMDQNSMQLMVDEMSQQIEEKKKIISEQDITISEQNKTISEQDKTISEQDKTISEQDKTINQKDNEIAELRKELERLKQGR